MAIVSHIVVFLSVNDVILNYDAFFVSNIMVVSGMCCEVLFIKK